MRIRQTREIHVWASKSLGKASHSFWVKGITRWTHCLNHSPPAWTRIVDLHMSPSQPWSSLSSRSEVVEILVPCSLEVFCRTDAIDDGNRIVFILLSMQSRRKIIPFLPCWIAIWMTLHAQNQFSNKKLDFRGQFYPLHPIPQAKDRFSILRLLDLYYSSSRFPEKCPSVDIMDILMRLYPMGVSREEPNNIYIYETKLCHMQWETFSEFRWLISWDWQILLDSQHCSLLDAGCSTSIHVLSALPKLDKTCSGKTEVL